MSASRGFSIRHAEATDAEAIARLAVQLGYLVEAATLARRLDKLLQRPTHAVFVACDEDGTVHGFIALEQRLLICSGERVEIVALAVDQAQRRSGAGRALVMAGELWAHKRGVAKVFLSSNVLREESHPFYAHLGYDRTKTQHAYARELKA